MYKRNLVLNKLQELICCKTTNQLKCYAGHHTATLLRLEFSCQVVRIFFVGFSQPQLFSILLCWEEKPLRRILPLFLCVFFILHKQRVSDQSIDGIRSAHSGDF